LNSSRNPSETGERDVRLVDQAQLVAAFQAWSRDKARPPAEHLGELPLIQLKHSRTTS
jgi:hypothetical protein